MILVATGTTDENISIICRVPEKGSGVQRKSSDCQSTLDEKCKLSLRPKHTTPVLNYTKYELH